MVLKISYSDSERRERERVGQRKVDKDREKQATKREKGKKKLFKGIITIFLQYQMNEDNIQQQHQQH